MKKKKKVLKLKIPVVIIFISIIIISYLSFNYIKNLPIKNIYIFNNKYLLDQEIIDTARLDNYPSFMFTTTKSIKNNLTANPFINNVNVKKKWFGIIELEIYENKPILKNMVNSDLVLSNLKIISTDKNYNVPLLINYTPSEQFNNLVVGLNRIERNILEQISEITYMPNEQDKNRFLLYMDDGNSVYITLTKIDNINYYNDVVIKLNGKKGILYLDSGNHFEEKK